MDYAGNSKKSKDKDDLPEKKIEKVIEGTVIQKKKPLSKRFMETFFGGDFKSAAQYLAAEVLLPEARRMIVEMAWKGTERVVFGDTRARPRGYQGYSSGSRYNYNAVSYSQDPRERQLSRSRANLPDQPSRPQPRARAGDQDLIFPSREEAERVLEQLMLIIDKYDVTSVADLHEMVGLPTTHTDQKWGWDRLTDVVIRQVREGYLLDLPPADPIN